MSGNPQALVGIGKVRVTLAAREGAPKAPLKPLPVRVSAMRQGVMG